MVGTEKLDKDAPRAVSDQIDDVRKIVALEVQKRKNAEQQEQKQRFVQLRGDVIPPIRFHPQAAMIPEAALIIFFHERAVAAPAHQAADSADRMGERDTDGRDLQNFHKFAFMHALVFFKIEMPHAEINADKDQRAADKAAHSGDARIGEIERAVLDPIVNRLKQIKEELLAMKDTFDAFAPKV